MKKYLFACLFVLLALFSLSGSIRADAPYGTTLILSNELGSSGLQGGLFDRLIAKGYGSKNLYQILQLLAEQPGSGIPAGFVTAVGSSPAGSEVFTTTLSDVAPPVNNPIGISADGTIIAAGLYGRDYNGQSGYTTSNADITGVARFSTIMATSSAYYIDAGSLCNNLGVCTNYKAIGIVYTHAKRSFAISNEEPGYLIDKLIAAGYQNLYQALQFLAAKSGSGIPADFVTDVGNHPTSDAFTAALSNFADWSNNPIVIGDDGTLIVAALYGRNCDGKMGYVTNNIDYAGIGKTRITMATSPAYYIDAGSNGGVSYQAIGIAWTGDTTPPAAPTGLTVD